LKFIAVVQSAVNSPSYETPERLTIRQ